MAITRLQPVTNVISLRIATAGSPQLRSIISSFAKPALAVSFLLSLSSCTGQVVDPNKDKQSCPSMKQVEPECSGTLPPISFLDDRYSEEQKNILIERVTNRLLEFPPCSLIGINEVVFIADKSIFKNNESGLYKVAQYYYNNEPSTATRTIYLNTDPKWIDCITSDLSKPIYLDYSIDHETCHHVGKTACNTGKFYTHSWNSDGTPKKGSVPQDFALIFSPYPHRHNDSAMEDPPEDWATACAEYRIDNGYFKAMASQNKEKPLEQKYNFFYDFFGTPIPHAWDPPAQ
ncbi:MAG: hypothetical protein WC624_01395 [Candidatus Margulisiibacteriota bacterium]